MASTSKAGTIANEFLAACVAEGFTVEIRSHGGDAVVSVTTTFTAGDRSAYVRCDGIGPSLLSRLPMVRPGSVWGTDGASVGGHAGLTGGYYRLSKSGVALRVASAIEKGMAA
jgi:hypothetical protein